MTKWQRIKAVLGALLSVIFVPVLLIDIDFGCALIAAVLGFSAAIDGIRMIIYFFSMARHMVCGRLILYQGAVMLDFGAFTLCLATVPSQYIMAYLIIGYLFYGVIEILNSLEIKKKKLGSWRFKFATGIGSIVFGIVCLTQIGSTDAAVYLYCFGVICSAIGHIISAFRPSAIVYVEAP